MFVPSPYGQAFVTSQTLDVYQQTLCRRNTVYGFVARAQPADPARPQHRLVPHEQPVPPPGLLDGMIGYVYNPATLPTARRPTRRPPARWSRCTTATSRPGEVGHDASYMRVVEAYQLKKQIDQQAFNSLALYKTRLQHYE